MDQLQALLRQRRAAPEPVEPLETCAQERPRLCVAAERAALRRAGGRCELDGPTLETAGARSHRVLRCATTSNRAAGPLRVARRVSRQQPARARAVCPLDLRAGILEGSWTPLAAQQAPWVVAQLTPQEGEARLTWRGTRTPSTRTLERWPTPRRPHWEAQRLRCAATLRQPEAIPTEAVAMAVSLDGVMGPRPAGARHAKRAQAVAQGKAPSGPAGSQEVGGAPVSSDDRHGARLDTRRMARLPATPPATRTSQLTAEVRGAVGQRPDVRVVTVAAGAPDHGSSRSAVGPLGEEGLACSHAVAHLPSALGAASGEGRAPSRPRSDT